MTSFPTIYTFSYFFFFFLDPSTDEHQTRRFEQREGLQFERRDLGIGFPLPEAKAERRGEAFAAKGRDHAAYSLSADETRGARAKEDQAQDSQQNLRPGLAQEEKGVRGRIGGSCETVHRGEYDAAETHQGVAVAESEPGWATQEAAGTVAKRQ